jgi:hypothetical protein
MYQAMMLTIALVAALATTTTTTTATATASPATPAAKLPPETAKEMAEAIIAVNKALGLESWTMQGFQPCIDRGGQGITAKDVSAEDTRKCAATAIDKGFPELGKSYVLAILMASIGPFTVIALGTGDAAGWGAYSCDPGRKCPPLKISPGSKWGKRMVERQGRACAEAATVWFPAGQRACPAPAAQ